MRHKYTHTHTHTHTHTRTGQKTHETQSAQILLEENMSSRFFPKEEKLFAEKNFCGIYFCDLGQQNKLNSRNLFMQFDHFR